MLSQALKKYFNHLDSSFLINDLFFFFKNSELKTYHEVIDEIYNHGNIFFCFITHLIEILSKSIVFINLHFESTIYIFNMFSQ